MSEHRPPLPPWPEDPPHHGAVTLRAVQDADVEMARELSEDPYVPLIGTLPAHGSGEELTAWIRRQQGRHAEGTGFAFTITDADDTPVGHCGLWLRNLHQGRASAGYAITPSARGRGLAADALNALTRFGWSLEGLHRIELFIEPWNTASVRTAERAGYVREGLLCSHQEIGGRRRDMLLYAAVRP
ncbi:GNAT family N-acetyltransferase [Nesterenkonia sp. PF2B19]|uniref:GNAT family N-acetyltransferase n=1 Tax=Nesterenkonia sp. PF2B19 TaxID=1881858 RepID=UPI0008732419|nr:GNAT family N-acetyltransferase [Nesterenkonia sp. PF2B19]OSM43087.1 GNAT family N-acetyltransferase [Nesterenkonia sp. PF2B19]